MRQRFALLADVLDDGDAFGGDLVHLRTGGDHPHAQLVDDQHLPLALLVRRADHVVHDLCVNCKGMEWNSS